MIPKSLQWLHPKTKNMLDFHTDDIMLYFNCHHLGTVQSFNPANQTATATIDYQKVQYVYDASTGQKQTQFVAYPPLTDCPVFFPCGSQGGVIFPLSVGDKCDIFFNDRDMDDWCAGALNQAPATARLHDFSDAIIFVGTRPAVSPLSNFNTGFVMLRGRDGTSYVGIDVSNGKIKVVNSSGNLATILQTLISHLQGLTIISGAVSPTSQAQLAADASALSGVLE